MGIKERHERDRDAVRRSILDSARDLFVNEGYQHVSIRKIAERIEYSPAAIYSYFPSKDDIFFALAEEGFQLLGGLQEKRAAERPQALEPLSRLRAIFWRIYEFSRQHPQYFALMFVDRTVPRISREYERFAFAREMKGQLVAEIQQCIDDGVLPGAATPHGVFRVVMAGLVGVAILRLSERIAPNEDADQIAEDVLDVTLAGLRSGIVLRTATTASCDFEKAEVDSRTEESR